MPSTIRLRRDFESDWEASSASRLKAGEPGLYHDAGTGDFLGKLKVGRMVAGNDDASTLVSDLDLWSLLSQSDKDKLDALSVLSGADMVAAINAELSTDLATAINATSLTYNGLATILDLGPNGSRWRNAAISIYGNAADGDGDLSLADDAVPMAAIDGLIAALAGKSDTGHGHTTSQVLGLDAALAALSTDKVDQSAVGVFIAELEDGVLKASQVPPGITAPVLSVFGRTGAIVKQSGDYGAADVTAGATGTLSAGTVASQLAALETNKIPNDGAGKIPTSYLPTVTVTDYRAMTIALATANVAINPVPTAYQIWNGSTSVCTPAIDTTYAKRIYIQSVTSTAGPTGSKLRPAYRVGGWSGTVGDWTQLTGGDFGFGSGDGTGVREGAKITLPAGAIGTAVNFAVLSGGGDGVANGTVGRVTLVIEFEIPLGPGTPTGAQMVTAINAQLGSTAWQSGTGSLSDGSVTLAKIVNFATQTAPLRKSAGTGVLEAGNQSDWRTFLDVTNTFNSRKGAVVPATGDYTADQITETGTKVFVSPSLLQAMTRWNTSTTFTTSDIIGYNEAWATFGGTGTLVLTGTLTNGSIAFFVNIFNNRTVAVNIVAQAGRTMAKQDGTVITTYSLPAKTGLCAKVEGTVWVLQV